MPRMAVGAQAPQVWLCPMRSPSAERRAARIEGELAEAELAGELQRYGELLKGALGELKEPAAAPFFEDKLLRPGWDGVRPHLLLALGRMGGDRAERILLDYLAHPKAGDHFYAITALRDIDPEAGAREAARYLSSRPRNEISEVVLPYLERWAGVE